MKGLLVILPMKEEKLSLQLLRLHLKISSFQIQWGLLNEINRV
jgi:hypothetical protein